MKKLLLILLLLAVAQLSAATYAPPQAEPKQPPTLDEDFKGVEFAVRVKGSAPMSYQWYRGTVKITGNDTAQTATLELSPPYVAGLYHCIATNSAGSIKSKTFRLSLTSSTTAADQQIVIRKP